MHPLRLYAVQAHMLIFGVIGYINDALQVAGCAESLLLNYVVQSAIFFVESDQNCTQCPDFINTWCDRSV